MFVSFGLLIPPSKVLRTLLIQYIRMYLGLNIKTLSTFSKSRSATVVTSGHTPRLTTPPDGATRAEFAKNGKVANSVKKDLIVCLIKMN